MGPIGPAGVSSFTIMATSLDPSAEEATAYHPNPFVGELAMNQVTPALVEMNIPLWSDPRTATNLVRSAELAKPWQDAKGAEPVGSQVTPAFVEAKIWPPTATNFMPSAEQAIPDQLVAGAEVCVHAIPPLVEA